MADDYFTAMQRVEQRLEIVSEPKQEENIEVVKEQEQTRALQLIERLELPELCVEERLSIANQLRQALGMVYEHAPPEEHEIEGKWAPSYEPPIFAMIR